MGAKEDLAQLWSLFSKVRHAVKYLQKYKSNVHYKKQYQDLAKELNKTFTFLEARVKKSNRPELSAKFSRVRTGVNRVLSNSSYDEKVAEIDALEMYWPELEVEFESQTLSAQSFELPQEIPMTDYRLDLEEAIRDYDNGCYPSALVMCRRAYEGALVEAFKPIEGRDPTEDVKCKNCGATLRSNSYMGVSKLHDWALKKDVVIERMKLAGFLITDVGAGAAHPPLIEEFPRDKELAKVGIVTTVALIKQVVTRTRVRK